MKQSTAMTRQLGIPAVLCAALLLNGCEQRFRNLGQAMSPTIEAGENVIATRSFDTLMRGDIVVHKYPQDESKNFVKRIVGLPGERIQSIEGRVLIDGRPLDESYVIEQNRSPDSWGPLTVAEGEYFVMGDNRINSSDSRTWGTVKRALIWAKVLR